VQARREGAEVPADDDHRHRGAARCRAADPGHRRRLPVRHRRSRQGRRREPRRAREGGGACRSDRRARGRSVRALAAHAGRGARRRARRAIRARDFGSTGRGRARDRRDERQTAGGTSVTRNHLVIATRGSALALWQANHVKARLTAIAPELTVELLVIKTSGDQIQDIPLAKVGGKGLFVKEIEQALIEGRADLAVHSMKDVPPELAPGLSIAAVSARETPWDALCARQPVTLDTLPQGATVGTSSMRRQCQLLARRPDLRIKLLRGNVPTRIKKLDAGEFDA